MAAVVTVVGHANTGKTTLIARLIGSLAARGYRVAAVKHAAHGYDIDSKGKDSWRFFQAGASRVMVVGPESLTVHTRYNREPTLAELGSSMEGIDLVLAEGFKTQAGPKIEVLRPGFSEYRLPIGADLVAVVSDCPVAGDVPCFSPDQVEPLADFIVERFLSGERSEDQGYPQGAS